MIPRIQWPNLEIQGLKHGVWEPPVELGIWDPVWYEDTRPGV